MAVQVPAFMLGCSHSHRPTEAERQTRQQITVRSACIGAVVKCVRCTAGQSRTFTPPLWHCQRRHQGLSSGQCQWVTTVRRTPAPGYVLCSAEREA